MGVYYKLVNKVTKQRIEPSRIGEGGIKIGPLCLGDAAKLFTFIHSNGVQIGEHWQIINDTGYSDDDLYYDCKDKTSHLFYEDKTEYWVEEFNSVFPDYPIKLRAEDE